MELASSAGDINESFYISGGYSLLPVSRRKMRILESGWTIKHHTEIFACGIYGREKLQVSMMHRRTTATKQQQWDPNELIMNYKDICCIYGRDLNLLLLRKEEWLNDTILHYWFIRLQENIYTTITTTTTYINLRSNCGFVFDTSIGYGGY